jgi:hypothetical protein
MSRSSPPLIFAAKYLCHQFMKLRPPSFNNDVQVRILQHDNFLCPVNFHVNFVWKIQHHALNVMVTTEIVFFGACTNGAKWSVRRTPSPRTAHPPC